MIEGVMSAQQVMEVLETLRRASITAWVDGGWGVDALLGEQTREHDDLDLVVPAATVPLIRRLLEATGFAVERDWLPTALAMRHQDARAVDLHPVELDVDGGGDQQLGSGRLWHYAAPVSGSIGGLPVLCCSPETQLDAHLGYEPDDNDLADMTLLAQRFGLTLPPPYQSG